MLTLQSLKEQLIQIGIINLIPVGSAVTKSVRRDQFMVDVILNFNKASICSDGNNPEQEQDRFKELIIRVEGLLCTKLVDESTSDL